MIPDSISSHVSCEAKKQNDFSNQRTCQLQICILAVCADACKIPASLKKSNLREKKYQMNVNVGFAATRLIHSLTCMTPPRRVLINLSLAYFPLTDLLNYLLKTRNIPPHSVSLSFFHIQQAHSSSFQRSRNQIPTRTIKI